VPQGIERFHAIFFIPYKLETIIRVEETIRMEQNILLKDLKT
jgi:hypothetical protein